MRKQRVLITGGAGFIGSHTADALAKKGFLIRIFDNLNPPVHTKKWPSYVLGKGYELFAGDVRERKDWIHALRQVDYVVHVAAYQDQVPDFSTFFAVNTVGTALLYELAVARRLQIKKIVIASSQFVYGDGEYRCAHKDQTFYPELRTFEQFKKRQWEILCPHKKQALFIPFREDQLVNPTNSYGLSKVALENTALRLGKTYRLPTVILRYSIVQGARQSPFNMYSGALRIFVSQALAELPITVYEDGLQERDFVNVEDVVAANSLVMNKKAADFQIFNVGSGRGYKVIDFANQVKEITGSPSPISLRGEFRKTDTRHALSDVSKLKKLGWRPRYSPDKSIREYVRWFRAEGFENSLGERLKKVQKYLRKMGVVSNSS